MEVILVFVRNHYMDLIKLVLLVITLIILIFKKKVKVDDTFELVLLLLPELIKDAESLNIKGSDKFAYVFNKCVVFIQSITHKKASVILDEYTLLINEAIENILSTPQKK